MFKPTLYYYFPSKRVLCEDVVKIAFSQVHERLKKELSGELTLEEGIEAVLSVWFEYFRRNVELAVFIAQISFNVSPDVPCPLIRELRERNVSLISDFCVRNREVENSLRVT